MSFIVCKVIRGIQAQFFSLIFFHLPVVRFHALYRGFKASDEGESFLIASCEKTVGTGTVGLEAVKKP